MSSANEPCLRVRLLANFQVSYGDTVITNSRVKASRVWKLFKYIITNRKKSIPTDTLIEVLWPDETCENPVKSLYSLVHRLRQLLAQGDPSVEYIIFKLNSYTWNSDAPCVIDSDIFRDTCLQAKDSALPYQQRVELCRRAVDMYTGDYLLESAPEDWVLPFSNYYKHLYVQTVTELADLYAEAADYESVISVCSQATANDPYEESFHERIMQSLIMQGKKSQAISHYRAVSGLLDRELGAGPSDQLQRLYQEVCDDSREDKFDKYDITAIERSLKNQKSTNGALFCQYDVFKQIYLFDMRLNERLNYSPYLALITIVSPEQGLPDAKTLKTATRLLKRVCLLNLRQGDVICQYSQTQFVLLLAALTHANGLKVLERMNAMFQREYTGPKLILQTNLSLLSAGDKMPATAG